MAQVPQHELMERARADLDKMMGILAPLSEEEWTGLLVPHFYMGAVPAFVYAGGLLVPFMFIIWQSTLKADADLTPFTIGIKVTGRNAGDYRVSIGEGGMTYEPGDLDDLPAVIEFDAGSLVLTTFGRFNGGTIRGDEDLADRFLNLFFRI